MYKYKIIVSSKAGSISKDKLIYKIKKSIPSNVEYEIIVTEHENHVKNICLENKNCDNTSIIVCGGDGTINEAANALAGSDTPLGIIPTGTGNDLARSVYGKLSLDEIISNIHKLKPTPIDLIDVELGNDGTNYKTKCINVLSFGLDSFILKTALEIKEKHPWLKGNSYFIAILKCISNIELLDLDIKYGNGIEEKYLKEKMVLGAICNGGYYGNGFNPNPLGKLNDEVLEICLLKKTPIFELLNLILKYRKGNHIGNEKVIFDKCTSGEVSISNGKFLLNIDGIVFKCEKVKWKVSDEPIKLLRLN